jgi:cytochrome P450
VNRVVSASLDALSRSAQRGRALPDAMQAAPELSLSAGDAERGEVAQRQAAAAEMHGPVIRGNVPCGPDAGPCVYLIGPEALEIALTSRVAAFSSDEGWRHVLGRGCGRAVLNTDDPEHAAERRMWAPSVSNTAIQTHWKAVNATIGRCVDAMTDGVEFDAYAALRALAYEAVAQTMTGLPAAAVEPSFAAIRAVLDGQDFARESRESYVERANAARGDLARILLDVIAERRRSLREPSMSMLDQLLVHPAFADPATDEAIRAHLTILLIAAHDTGATMFSRAVYVLAERPDVAERLARELEAARLSGSDELPIPQLDRLPCLQRFLLEAGRLYPSLVNLPRVMVENVEVGGYRLAAGTRVALAAGATHLLSRLYPDPLRFDLDRYRDPFASRTVHSFGMLTFSGGTRMCMGKRFAQLEFKAIMARIVSRVSLRAVDDSPVPHAGFWNPRPGRPLRVVARAR